MSLTTIEALQETATAYYERYRFADVFAHVERAPEHLAERLAQIPGVQTVETRVVALRRARRRGLRGAGDRPARVGAGDGEPVLNRLALRSGRYPRLGPPDEAVLSEPFAEAHGLGVGDHAARRSSTAAGATLDGRRHRALARVRLRDRPRRADAGRQALRRAVDGPRGAAGGVRPRRRVQRRLARPAARRRSRTTSSSASTTCSSRYGGVGAYARADQLSNWFLMNEIEQLKTLSTISADDLPRRRGVPDEHGAGAAHRRGAQRDRPAQGLRLPQARHRAGTT